MDIEHKEWEKSVKCAMKIVFHLSAALVIGPEVNDDGGIALHMLLFFIYVSHRLNKELDFQSFFGLLCTAVLIG
jgi:hypothetical protein